MPGSGMRGEAGASCQGEPGQVGSRGVRARACVSEPQIKMHVLGHRGGGRTGGRMQSGERPPRGCAKPAICKVPGPDRQRGRKEAG